MSFTGSAGGSPMPDTKQFFCYKCSRTVSIAVPPSADPSCPNCREGFLEECDDSTASPNFIADSYSDPFGSLNDQFTSLLPLLFSSNIERQNPSATSIVVNSRDADPNVFNPLNFLRNHIQTLQSSGARIQLVIEDSPSGGFRAGVPGNPGDYFFGQGLEQLIQQLMENDPNRYGTPPASKSSIEKLPTVKITEGFSNSEMNQCAVCKDEFDNGAEVKQMPCKHLFHDECILPWLELHNSCPVCRYELPTEDSDYERRKNDDSGNQDGSSGGNSSAGGGDSGTRTVQRSFSISLPWPFGGGGQSSS